MQIALAQINPTVADLVGNRQLILNAVKQAHERGAHLVVCSELAICGYPPKDLLLRSGFIEACDKAIEQLAAEIPDNIGLLVGHPTLIGSQQDDCANAASLLFGGKIQATIRKCLLPNYDVFDERRYFQSASSVDCIEFQGMKLGVHICEDAWYGEPDTFYHLDPKRYFDPVAKLAEQGAELYINLSASPFEIGKLQRRQEIIRRHVERHRIPYLFVNQVGGNDDLVFDGQSFAISPNGSIYERLARFDSDLQLIDVEQLANSSGGYLGDNVSNIADLNEALVLGLRDYMRKCGFKECILGLSGGIDSAVASCLAAQAVGAENVHALMMPSRYSSQHSVDDSIKLANALGIDAQLVPIDVVHTAFEQTELIGPELEEQPGGLADQNVQARIRGILVMARSNHHSWIALATGNKSELSVGYCTLYGDMAGGFAVLSDVFKRDVYALARYMNEHIYQKEVIPQNIITKAPSAELAPDQFDHHSLPDYPILDGILEGLVEREESVEKLSETFPRETVEWIRKRLDRNEFKRRQMAPGIKLSPRAFGSGRRMPMAANLRTE